MLYLFLIFSLLFVGSTAHAQGWQTLQPGLFYKTTEVIQAGQTVAIHALKVDPGQYTLKPLIHYPGKTAKGFAQTFNATAVVNANFFDTNGRVLGLVKQDGRRLNPLKNISWWSVFCLHQGEPKIYHQSNHLPGQCEQAIQAGPRLVVGGNIPRLKNESSRKTAIGINRQGQVILVVTEAELPIQELAQIFRLPEEENGFDCPNAMNLDGGSSSQFYVHVGDFVLNVPGLSKVPVGLGVVQK